MSGKNRFKDFGAGVKKDSTPLSFKLHDEEFHCVPRIQGQVLLDLISSSSDSSAQSSAEIMRIFFQNVLQDESHTRFEALTRDKNKIVEVETLEDFVSWLMEDYGDRPPTQPED